MKIIISYFVFCLFIISCSDNKKIEKINDYMWTEPLDASVFIDDQGETIMKTVYFEINGIQYSVFLLFYPHFNEVEPVVINISGRHTNSSDKKEVFIMRLENYGERYFHNEIIHNDIGFLSLFDKKNKSLKYKQFPNNNYWDQIAVTDENSFLLFVYPEWELEDDWKIEKHD